MMASDTERDDGSRSPSADDSESDEGGDAGEDHDMDGQTGQENKNGGGPKKSSNAKDPSRPRRKKARRACYACQRAHLTCGDERPCQRCIKRGLQDNCQDGVRKKAKYLHDAPPEALMPGGAGPYQYLNDLQRTQQSQSSPTYPVSAGTDDYSQQAAPAYSGYGSSPPGTAMTLNDSLVSPAFNNPQSPLATQMQSNAGLSSAGLQGLRHTLTQQNVMDGGNGLSGAGFDGNFFDAGELAQYDFDPTSFNFGNHYGALEFGMLGHLSSGAIGTSPPGEVGNPLNQAGINAFATPNTISTSNYGESPVDGNQPVLFKQDSGLSDWRPTQPQSNMRHGGSMIGPRSRDSQNGFFDQDVPRAFSVGVNSVVASPTSKSPEHSNKPSSKDGLRARYPPSSNSRPGTHEKNNESRGRQPLSAPSVFSVAATRALAPKRKRGDPSTIYTNVTQPYSYITGFHSLILLLQKRFPPAKVLRIAKALASIRPSFMSCTRTLGRDDLIFMEKCFQRTLWEYEDFINACGTPTVVCRRTGEIAAAGKEFSILTKWRRDVLLGREPNLNVNAGGVSPSDTGTTGPSGASSATRGAGASTPRLPESMIDNSRPHPVSLAELLDADSVVAFYEDFARLAFGDSKGTVTARYRLLKYRTKEEEAQLMAERDKNGRLLKRKRGPDATKPGQVSGEAGIDDLGEDGKVECSCCWTVKRDIFDLPMMIVMNFLPCI